MLSIFYDELISKNSMKSGISLEDFNGCKGLYYKVTRSNNRLFVYIFAQKRIQNKETNAAQTKLAMNNIQRKFNIHKTTLKQKTNKTELMNVCFVDGVTCLIIA